MDFGTEMKIAMTAGLVVCETAAAVVLHLRTGSFMPCGRQNTDTLCEKRPAWDTHIPVSVFAEPIESETLRCRTCRDIFLEKSNERRN